MSLNETDISKKLFKQNGPSELLKLIDEEEKLSPESEQLLLDIGASMLATIIRDASLSAKSRGSDIIEQKDLQFISEPWTKNQNNEVKTENEEEIYHEKNTGSPEHQQRLQMIQRFNQTNEQ
ncbi:Transcription initiation factor TFIID subunit 12 [Tritrichomonas musculus]|uniref:Transcription initiation factor TFIID subunit 12 n=1 Tax=Tritrichomonas musculus TaxID=1915356 RepID=A0ABR2GL04_9EUKA